MNIDGIIQSEITDLSEEDAEDIRLLELLQKQPKVEQAWRMGEVFNRLENKSYTSFIKACKKIGITNERAQEYILVYKLPKFMVDIGLSLHDIFEIAKAESNDKARIIKVLEVVENDTYVTNKRKNTKKIYSDKTYSCILDLLDSSSKYSDCASIAKKFIDTIIQPQIERNEMRHFAKKIGQKTKLNTNFFPDLEDLYPHEPISEHGFVALFFAMFHLLKHDDSKMNIATDSNLKVYKFDLHKQMFSFNKLIYVQSNFPDATINMNILNKNDNIIGNADLYVELEYLSQDYIGHKHHLDNKVRCDLIICWQNNWVDKSRYFAPIISIKELLDTGNIKVHHR